MKITITKKQEIVKKLEYLQTNHFSEWLKTRQVVEGELSDKATMFCICGRLATGLHERGCKKFSDSITKETLKRLNYLYPRDELNRVLNKE